ncbi:MAG: hypothetical protein IH881_15630 [Myxococcales bacterium]|nr:hypothetical protein [Myxococcales bacterium]
MRRAVNLAAALKGKKWDQLEAWIRINPPWVSYVDPKLYDADSPGSPYLKYLESSGVIKATLCRDIEEGQTSKAGRKLLEEIINTALSNSTRVGVDLEGDRPRQQIFAGSLLAALWLQFLNSVTEERISTCAMCSTLIIDPPAAIHRRRAELKTCSATCRTRLSRRRKAEKAAAT